MFADHKGAKFALVETPTAEDSVRLGEDVVLFGNAHEPDRFHIIGQTLSRTRLQQRLQFPSPGSSKAPGMLCQPYARQPRNGDVFIPEPHLVPVTRDA